MSVKTTKQRGDRFTNGLENNNYDFIVLYYNPKSDNPNINYSVQANDYELLAKAIFTAAGQKEGNMLELLKALNKVGAQMVDDPEQTKLKAV
jgi:hypothetical protein